MIAINKKLLSYLCCPKCKGNLDLIILNKDKDGIIEGKLTCKCGTSFPVIKGVPNMLINLKKNTDSVRKSFYSQWKIQGKFYDNPNKIKTWGLEAEERKTLFLEQMDIKDPNILKNKSLLDAGCGNGHLSIKLADYGLEVIAMDITESIYFAYKYNKNKDKVFFVQGDVMNPPFKQKIFDYIYCSGVLHHTPNTKKSFMALAKLVKPKGRYWVWLYIKISRIKCKNWIYDNKFKLYLYDFIPKIVGKIPLFLKDIFCYSLIPLFIIKQEIEIKLGIKKFDKTDQYRRAKENWRDKLIDLHDNFTHRYNYRHTPEEVIEWFKEANFENINYNYKKEGGGFGIYGIKS